MIFIKDLAGYEIQVPTWSFIVAFALVVACAIAFYVLRSIGIYKLSKKSGVKTAWLAWIPGAWIYPTCKTIGNSRFFGTTISKVAVWFTILYSVASLLYLANYVIAYVPIVGYCIQGGERVTLCLMDSLPETEYTKYVLLEGVYFAKDFDFTITNTMVRLLYALNVLTNITHTLKIAISVFIYFALFRKFWPEYHVLASILSIIITGIFPIFVFVIRNKQAVDYGAYIRSKMNINEYGNPNSQNQYQNGPKDPFENFSSENKKEDAKNPKNDNPFSDFDDN